MPEVRTCGSTPHISTVKIAFKNAYMPCFSALPTNTQFTERAVKESGYVSLGNRNEKQRSILAIACGKTLSEALEKGRKSVKKNDVRH